MLLGIAPIAALPLMAGGLPAGFRDQVLRLATGNSPAAVAHRAAVAKTSYSFGHHGFPRPLHQPGPHWWHPLPAHTAAVAGTATATAVAAGVTVIAGAPHHGLPPAGAATASVTSSADPVPGGVGPPGAARPGGTATATARASVLPTASGGFGAGTPTAGVAAASSSAGPSGATASPGVSASASDPPGAGTLSVSPATLDVTPAGSGYITLTASGGAVSWSVSEPPGQQKKVVVTPMSGTLATGQTTTVTVTVERPGKPKVHLTFSPGGAKVEVLIS
jgi:hypothetical protein